MLDSMGHLIPPILNTPIWPLKEIDPMLNQAVSGGISYQSDYMQK